jgi:hypothetical protein
MSVLACGHRVIACTEQRSAKWEEITQLMEAEYDFKRSLLHH